MGQISIPITTNPELTALLEQAKRIPVSPEMLMQQRLSMVLSIMDANNKERNRNEPREATLKRLYNQFPEFALLRDYLSLKDKLAKIQGILTPVESSGD